MIEPTPPRFPLWSLLWLVALGTWYDERARPTLAGLAIISSGTAVVGYAGQYDAPTVETYLRCIALGFALWLIARTFWAGAWMLPALETKHALSVYALVAVHGFVMFATVSTLGSLGATGGGISRDITQTANIDALVNT